MKDDENAPRGRETMLPDLLAARADAASVLVVDDAEANARVITMDFDDVILERLA